MNTNSECSFDVREVAVQESPDEDMFVVALAEEPGGEGRLLMFQLGLAFDEQDVALGQDTYCVCDERGATVYGGVTSWSLEDNLLTIRFNTKASTRLAIADECRLRLLVDSHSIDLVLEGLRRVLGGP